MRCHVLDDSIFPYTPIYDNQCIILSEVPCTSKCFPSIEGHLPRLFTLRSEQADVVHLRFGAILNSIAEAIPNLVARSRIMAGSPFSLSEYSVRPCCC